MADSALPPPRSRLILERVLGLTALSNAQVAVNPVSGELAYAAGCIVVVYNLRRNKQVRYYRVDKNVACLCFSPNGQFLAIGEKGYLPAITIWDGTDGTLCAELQRHQYGVACMAFSQDGRFLLTAGLVHDQHLYAWELKKKDTARRLDVVAVGCAFVDDKILDADYCQAGNFFVTVGEKHFKYWFLDDSGSFLVTGLTVNELPELQHRDATVNAKTSATFTGVGCGYGSCELKTFAVTSDGTLCCFGASGILERLVSLESKRGNAISVTESYVAVGGSSGVVRLFNPSTLEYRTTMPFPPAFGAANLKLSPMSPSVLYPTDPFRYPAAIATRITGSHVIVFYSDRSIFIYSTENPDAVTTERSFLYHSGGVCDLQVVGLVRGTNAKGKLVYDENGGISVATIPHGTFVTCSDDNTVRLWNLELHRRPSKSNRFEPTEARSEHEFWKNPYSQEMLRVIYNDQDRDFEDEQCIVLGGTCSHDSCSTVHSPPKDRGWNKGLRALAVRPDQKEIAAGDHEGNVVVMFVPLGKPAIRISAHNSKVNCLSYSNLKDDRPVFMASGGKDRLIHLYDCQRGHAVLSTLEKHSASVTNVALSRDGKTLLSCGADNSVSVSAIDVNGEATQSKVVPCTGGKVFDTVLLPDSDTVVVCGNNKLEVLSVSTGKLRQAHLVGEQHHVAVCPANYCVAMSGSFAERTIHVMDMKTGDTLATGTGHGEAVTSLKFTPDCRRLLSTSGDGCIFVWRLGDDIQAEIKAKLPRVVEAQHPIQAPPRATNNDHQEPVLPPPAPPLNSARQNKTPSSPEPLPPKDLTPTILEKATPKRVSKRSPPKWQGNGIAVPGPMAGIPMEDWMKTRATAKPTIHVIDDNGPSTELKTVPGTELKTPSNNGTLVIDRLQTPDWAKTALTEVQSGQPELNPSSGVQAVSHEALPHGKWGNQVAASFPSNDGASESKGLELSDLNFQQEANTQGERTAPIPKAVKADLTALSVEVSTTNPMMSSSLALEREQLEKRKKQIDTVNAVTAMNTRLSQLGLIKQSQRTTPTAQSRQMGSTTQSPPKKFKASPTNSSSNATVLPSPNVQPVGQSPSKSSITTTVTAIEVPVKDRRPDVPDKVLAESLGESFEMVPSPVESGRASSSSMEKIRASTGDAKDTNTDPSAVSNNDGDAHGLAEDLVSQALRTLNSVESPRSPPIVNVADSLSIHTSGYGPQGQNIATSADSQSRSPLEVEVSLSTFTSGFIASSRPSQEKEEIVQRSVETVASSLSVFTTGYRGQDHNPSTKESVDITAVGGAVNESISTFTSGYSTARREDPTKTPREVPVDISLSNFTSGYDTCKLQVDVRLKSDQGANPLPVTKASLSTFTSGYGAVVSPMSIGKTAANKSVDIQPPSPLDAPDNTPTSSKPTQAADNLEAAAFKAIGELSQPLEDAATALDDLMSNLAPEADPKLQEIQELIGALRSAVKDRLQLNCFRAIPNSK